MKLTVFILPIVAALGGMSCASVSPPQGFYSPEPMTLVIRSLDGVSAQLVVPGAMEQEKSEQLLDDLKLLERQKRVVVILENYSEPQLGPEFRDRSVGWFMGLRGLGYQHIVFVRGKGVTDPAGLPVLTEYN